MSLYEVGQGPTGPTGPTGPARDAGADEAG